MRCMTPDEPWLGAVWPFVRGQLPPAPATVLEIGCGTLGGFVPALLNAGHAIRLVAAGGVDAAAIDSQVLAIELRDHPPLADGLRVIDAFGPSTIQPVVADRFTPVGDGAYDDIRAMLATIEAAGWTSLTQTAVDL
jgi:hypothetical protein